MVLTSDLTGKYNHQLTKETPTKESLTFATRWFKKDRHTHCVVKNIDTGEGISWAVFIKK